MGKPRYLITNLLDGATLTPSTEDTTYVAEHLCNGRPGKPFKYTASVSGEVVIDLGEAGSATACAIVNHNITSGATIKIQGNASDSWGDPSVDETMTRRAENMYKCFTGGSYRYWRLSIAGNTGAAAIRIGELLLGAYVELDRGPLYPVRSKKSFDSADLSTVYGQKWSYEISSRWEFEYRFRLHGDSEKANMQALWDSAGGGRLPVLWIPDSAATDCYLVNLSGPFDPSNPGPYRYDLTLKLQELPAGKEG